MKITKSQLKQIIKEELEDTLNEADDSDQMVIERVREVVTLFSDLYNALPNDDAKELFETWLNANVELYTEKWRKDRRRAGAGLGGPGSGPRLPSAEEKAEAAALYPELYEGNK